MKHCYDTNSNANMLTGMESWLALAHGINMINSIGASISATVMAVKNNNYWHFISLGLNLSIAHDGWCSQFH